MHIRGGFKSNKRSHSGDDSFYLLRRSVPKRLAIIETNKSLVDKVDYIVAGVILHCGGAYAACKRKKPIINAVDGL